MGLALEDLDHPDFKLLPPEEQSKGRREVYTELMKNPDFRGLPDTERNKVLVGDRPDRYTQRPDVTVMGEIKGGFRDMTTPMKVGSGTVPAPNPLNFLLGAARTVAAPFAPITNLVSRGAKAISKPFEGLPPAVEGFEQFLPGKREPLYPAEAVGKTAEIVGDVVGSLGLNRGFSALKAPLKRAIPTAGEKISVLNQRLSEATRNVEQTAANKLAGAQSAESIAEAGRTFRLADLERQAMEAQKSEVIGQAKRSASIPVERSAIQQRTAADIAAERARLSAAQAPVGEEAARAAGPQPVNANFKNRYERVRTAGESVRVHPVNLNTTAIGITKEPGVSGITNQAERSAGHTVRAISTGDPLEIEADIGDWVRRSLKEGGEARKIDYGAVARQVVGPMTGEITGTEMINTIKRIRAAETAAYGAGHKNLGRQFHVMEKAALQDLSDADKALFRMHRNVDKAYAKKMNADWWRDGVQNSFNDKTGAWDRNKFTKWFMAQSDEIDGDRFLKRTLGKQYEPTKNLIKEMQQATEMRLEQTSAETVRNLRRRSGQEMRDVAKTEKGFDKLAGMEGKQRIEAQAKLREGVEGDFAAKQKDIRAAEKAIRKEEADEIEKLTAESKKAVEKITGKPYSSAWGKNLGIIGVVHGALTGNPVTVITGGLTYMSHEMVGKLLHSTSTNGAAALRRAVRAVPGTGEAISASNALVRIVDQIKQEELKEPKTPEEHAERADAVKKDLKQAGEGILSRYGIPPPGAPEIRAPYKGESEYFKKNPNVTGMAGEDDKVVLNPNSRLSDNQKKSVIQNESARIWMRRNPIPSFTVTPEQKERFKGTEYAGNEEALRQTIIARIVSNDPSAGNVTDEQRKIADSVRMGMAAPGIDTRPSSAKPRIQNPDGTVSSERTIGIESEGMHYLIPTIINGKQVTPDEAVKQWRAGTNKPLGIYRSREEVDKAAKERTGRLSREMRTGSPKEQLMQKYGLHKPAPFALPPE